MGLLLFSKLTRHYLFIDWYYAVPLSPPVPSHHSIRCCPLIYPSPPFRRQLDGIGARLLGGWFHMAHVAALAIWDTGAADNRGNHHGGMMNSVVTDIYCCRESCTMLCARAHSYLNLCTSLALSMRPDSPSTVLETILTACYMLACCSQHCPPCSLFYTWHCTDSPFLRPLSSKQVATRERPKLWFNAKGQKTHLINGVCSAANCPTGPPTGCVDCKYANWDYTLVQPLDV